jgi:phosphoglucosamine mutase
LRELGAEVIVYGNQPDGTNINKDCGSMHPELMCQKVKEHKADIGIAHDGDADRVLLCDEHGTMIDGDDIMAIATQDMLQQGQLAERTLEFVTKIGGKVVQTPVGDKNVIDEMLKRGFNFGGEQSGHMIFRDYSSTGDGLVCALQVLRIMKTTGQPLSELARCWQRFPQLVTNVRVREKTPFEQLNGILTLVEQAEAEVKPGGGRVLLRYSGTEPKARLLIEGRELGVLEKHTAIICDAIKKHVGI